MTEYFTKVYPSKSITDTYGTPTIRPIVNLKEVAGKRQIVDDDSSPEVAPLDLTSSSTGLL